MTWRVEATDRDGRLIQSVACDSLEAAAECRARLKAKYPHLSWAVVG
jgi:hypothetical protein